MSPKMFSCGPQTDNPCKFRLQVHTRKFLTRRIPSQGSPDEERHSKLWNIKTRHCPQRSWGSTLTSTTRAPGQWEAGSQVLYIGGEEHSGYNLRATANSMCFETPRSAPQPAHHPPCCSPLTAVWASSSRGQQRCESLQGIWGQGSVSWRPQLLTRHRNWMWGHFWKM